MRHALPALVLLLAAIAAALALTRGHGHGDTHTAAGATVQSCTDTGDRFTKIRLLENLGTAPHVLIIGSSRARPAMPSSVKDLTGGEAFNAGVQGGDSADEYVFTRLLAKRFPHAKPAYLIFADISIATDGVNPNLAVEPLARPYLGRDASSATSACTDNHEYTANGGLAYPPASAAQRAQKVAAGVAAALPGIPADAKKPRHISPSSTLYFQRLLRFINKQGATPVIVLNPIYPTILAARKKYGFPALQAAQDYLAWLHKRYHFILVNGEDIRKWGGTTSDFSNFDHIDRTNMNRLLAYVVQHSDGVLLAKR
jgi:hypothetical protein